MIENTSKTREKRIFVLDTNVLLHDSNSLMSFKGVVVGIPFAVLEELDTFKNERNDLGMNARNIIRVMDDLREKGSLKDGVFVDHGINSILKVLPTPKDMDEELCAKILDNIILNTVLDLKKNGYDVTLITKDINLRVKADFFNLEAEDYSKGAITYEEYYKGWRTISLPSIEVKKLTEKKLPELIGEEVIYPNEFVIVQSQHNEWNHRLFRFLGGKNYKEVISEKFWEDFEPRNVQQAMALDLLLDDSVKFVSLLGPAGTGKTFLVLLAGLFKVLKERMYRRFLISRPVIALGADVGYLPGDLQEKLFHWMQPVYDNFELIFSQMDGEDLYSSKERRQKKRKGEHGGGDQVAKIESLKQRGILSLEAITYMRGRSIFNQFVFIDEAQNLTPHEVKTIVSRAGEGSKIIIAGDPYQIDSPYLDFISNGLTVSSEKFKRESIFGTVFLNTSERSELAKLAAELL